MAGDIFGERLRVINWGESHGKGVGAIVEGCPAGLPLSEEDIQPDLDRRRPGQSKIVTQRKEGDTVEILSGTVNGLTTGTPISLLIKNKDQRSKDYSTMAELFRPSHADYTYQHKYGIRDVAGGGRSSARVTAGSVAAGAIAKKILHTRFNTRVLAYVKSVQDIQADINPLEVRLDQVESNPVRCPDPDTYAAMIERIEQVRKRGDSVGGVIECVCVDVPPGLGEPVYDKIEADLAKAMLGINATKGFEIGSGFDGTRMPGSKHNDAFYYEDGRVKTRSNHSGGVQGGITNGMPIIFRVAFKPTATIILDQDTLDKNMQPVTFKAKGRHDPCVLPRAVPIVEAMAALVLGDHLLRQQTSQLSYLP